MFKLSLPFKLPAPPLEADQDSLRLPLLRSKLMEYDGTVTAEERDLWFKLWLTRGFPKFFMQNLSVSVWFVLPIFIWIGLQEALSYIHYFGVAALIHPPFIMQLAGLSLLMLAMAAYFALAFVGVSLSSYSLYPQALYLSPKGFAFDSDKHKIAWHQIQLVQVRKLLLGRRRHTTVLELYLTRQPYVKPLNPLEKILDVFRAAGLKRNAFLMQPETAQFVENTYEGICLRLPLELFGFDADCQKFLNTLKSRVAPEALVGDLCFENSGNQSQSFTTIWLDDLRLPKSTDTERLLPVGHQLDKGNYEITDVLGYGGFSVVYGARQNAASVGQGSPSSGCAEGGRVAIKELVINSGGSRTSKDAILKQIVTEIDMLRALDHPNIVKCLDYFIDGGRVYIVMQVVEGTNLRDFVNKGGPLPERDLVEIGLQCCSILTYLHTREKPLMHRDFTPDNLIWDGKTVELVDFNVAEEANTKSSSTIVGKHCYLAPEQWCGNFTAAGDLYQLGCTLYFLAAGKDPEAITQSNPAADHPELSAGFVEVVRTLTEQEAGKRYATAGDAAAKLALSRRA